MFRQGGIERARLAREVAVTPPAAAPAPESARVVVAACHVLSGESFNGLLLRADLTAAAGAAQALLVTLGGPRFQGPPRAHKETVSADDHSRIAEFSRQLPGLIDAKAPEAREGRLRGIGRTLAQRFLGSELCALLADPRFPMGTPLHVESDAVWVPWELLWLDGGEAGGGGFLGERFALSRWLRVGSARERVGGGAVVLVSPPDSQLNDQLERQTLRGLTADPMQELHTLLEVQQQLSGPGRCGVMHFACHADSERAAPLPELLLLSGDETLRHTDIPPAPLSRAAALDSSLIFINACQAGIVEPSLWDHQGWAGAFLQGGAGAFISCCFTVNDRPAAHFAAEFYAQAKQGLPLAEAARLARVRARSTGVYDPLGYALYAAPHARLAV